MTTMPAVPDGTEFEQLEYHHRYYVQTAKNAIQGLGHIVAEAGSNEDEAISRRSERDGGEDRGRLCFHYDPDTMLLAVTGDGAGMTAATMRERLRYVGVASNEGSRRGFIHRGIREVFLAMGGGRVTSIGMDESGAQRISEAVFDPEEGMAIVLEDAEPTPEQRAELGLEGTGTRVEVSLARFAKPKPGQYTFNAMEQQIRDCVGIRPVLADPNREVTLQYGDESPRPLRFEYPEGEDLVALRDVEIGGQPGTFWAKVAPEPIKGARRGRQLRVNGILVRGQRATYEVSLGSALSSAPQMTRVFGELRLDGIEDLQREADARADDESQLVYKPDRSGLNPEHPLIEEVNAYIDETLGPLIADLGVGEGRQNVSGDMRRQLQKLARIINEVVDDAGAGGETGTGPRGGDGDRDRDGQTPPPPGPGGVRDVSDGIDFAHSRVFMEAGGSRTVQVWFDPRRLPPGTPVEVARIAGDIVHAAGLSGAAVPEPADDGVAHLDLTLKAGNTEGRHEITVRAGGLAATLVVHVRYPRAGGFISQIVYEDSDWESGSAVWNASNGVVTVYVGRPEFRDAKARAGQAGIADPWKDPLYRQLVAESVREAALWEAAQRNAEVTWDDLPYEERQDPGSFQRETRYHFQELDYMLRRKLLKVFVKP